MKKIIKSLIFICLCFSFCLLSGSQFVLAKEEGLTVSPPLQELNIEPGKIYEQSIKINNPTKELVTMYPIARNFSATGETGVPLIEDPNTQSEYDLASWITFEQSKIVLTSDQEVVFNYQIKVPTDAEPGGHYATVLFASEPPTLNKQQTQVSLASMVGVIVLAKVSGNIIEKAEVKEFSTDKRIYFSSPTNFMVRLSNTGNTHFKPQGEVTVTSMFQKKEVALDINPQKGNVLPNTTRKFENITWKFSNFKVGRFEAKLVTTYGSNQQSLVVAPVIFWIVPWWSIVILVLVLAIIIFLIIRARRRRKPKNNLPPPTVESVRRRVILQ